MLQYKNVLNYAIKPYSSLLFFNHKIVGILLLCITFIDPSVAISGIVAIICTIIFAHFIEVEESYLTQGFYIYNSLLVGMGIGYIYTFSLTTLVLIGTASILTFIVSFILNRLFSTLHIPILSLPFSLISSAIYLASIHYTALIETISTHHLLFDITLPLYLSGFFKSLGGIFFLPYNITGVLIFILIISLSRITALMALIGFYFGIHLHSYLIGSYTAALLDPYAFNYILVAIALCGVFLLPTIKNFFIAHIAIAISVVLTDALSILVHYFAIPVFTLPFNLTVMGFIFILSLIQYKEFNHYVKETPEESLFSYLNHIFRFGDSHVKISLPFSGVWSVYQAFNGKWTHQGEYKYAYDFVKLQEGKSYKNEGLYKEDYYCYGESILSPVSGYIVDARHDLQDNHIGEIDRVNNWGNYIIIKSDLGFFVEISHLMQYSLSVNVGEYVQENKIIAKCGNSGYSPEPHIHIQVQYLGVLGGFTQSFYFTELYQKNELIYNVILEQHDVVESVIQNKSISSRLLFILDDTYHYDVYEESKKVDTVIYKVQMNQYGEFYFGDNDSKLYFYHDKKQFYFYKYEGESYHLKMLFILAPRIPFINKKEIDYKDYLPAYLVRGRLSYMITGLLATVNQDIYKIEKSYQFSNDMVSSDLGSVELEAYKKGFKRIQYQHNNKEITLLSREELI